MRRSRLSDPLFAFSFICTLCLSGMLLYRSERNKLPLFSGRRILSGIITDYPEERKNSIRVQVHLVSDLTGTEPLRTSGSIVLTSLKEPALAAFLPGDRVIFSCSPEEIKNMGNPYEFDFKYYMESRGTRYQAFIGSKDLIFVRHPPRNSLRTLPVIIRKKIISMFRTCGVSEERLPLVAAITLGEKSNLDPEQKQYFIKAGIMHIMAVSGLHAVILSYFIFSILFFLKGKNNILRVIITILILWLFAFITGMSPSVVRAVLMFSFLQAGKLLKRPVNSLNSVLASATVLLLLRPSVIFDAGFLLSYSAVIFIIAFYNDIYRIFTLKNKIADLLWQSAAVTIAAQAGTLPLTIMLFNRFPVLFLFTNIIIVPVSSLLIIAGCIIPVSCHIPVIRELSGFILDKLTWLTAVLTEKAASIPFSSIDNIGLSVPECIALTVFITLLFIFLLKEKSRVKMLHVLSSLLLFILLATVRNVSTSLTSELVVYNTPGFSTIGIRTGKRLIIYSDSDTMPKPVVRHVSALGLHPEIKIIDDQPVLIRIKKRLILINGNQFYLPLADSLTLNIVTSEKPVKSQAGKWSDNGSTVILTRGLVPLRRGADSAKVFKDRVWMVKKSGAYCMRL
ncbi:MAG: ComEC/Rec2 family competence protein [Bacteroidales bacterium]